ncbi:hypothetical protein B0H63DRAFT_489668 [Podospora didyma]|uniref:Uncharacterized protein n=1 Tax=Podospora didyma TaxID=330526 RepID=A0AAE0K110_9PEZI|nr:hypothetical protein B0H63DRAFT_489668 [Podospora didyma]
MITAATEQEPRIVGTANKPDCRDEPEGMYDIFGNPDYSTVLTTPAIKVASELPAGTYHQPRPAEPVSEMPRMPGSWFEDAFDKSGVLQNHQHPPPVPPKPAAYAYKPMASSVGQWTAPVEYRQPEPPIPAFGQRHQQDSPVPVPFIPVIARDGFYNMEPMPVMRKSNTYRQPMESRAVPHAWNGMAVQDTTIPTIVIFPPTPALQDVDRIGEMETAQRGDVALKTRRSVAAGDVKHTPATEQPANSSMAGRIWGMLGEAFGMGK